MIGRRATRGDHAARDTSAALSVRLSHDDDLAWDEFLEADPAGSYGQTSFWARARTSIGWRPIRMVLSEEGRIVAGVQMETRPLPIGGAIGLVVKGPVVSGDRSDLTARVVDETLRLARSQGVRYLILQPPRGCERVAAELCARGFRRGTLDLLESQDTSSVRVDLSPDLEELLARMSKNCRQQIKSAEKHGVTVRLGDQSDMPIFNRLKGLHSARLGYDRRDEDYYTGLWHALAPHGHIEIYIAEYDGEPVSAQLAIPFRDTVHHVERPWSGEHGRLHPNELLKWEVMKASKAAGYRYADFGGIETSVSEAVLAGAPEAINPRYSASLFKLKFGGQVLVEPPFLDHVFNPVLRATYRAIPRSVMRSPTVNALVSRFNRTGA